MLKATRFFASLLAIVSSFAISGCGGSNSSTATTNSGTAQVRFINGSPDIGNVDIVINGKVAVPALSYRTISAYQSVTTGTNPLPAVVFTKAGTSTNIFPNNADGSAATFRLGSSSGTNLSVVLEGRARVIGSAGLNLAAFTEPTVTTAAGTYAVVFHHASPSAALSSPAGLDVGGFTAGATPTFTRYGLMLFSSSAGTGSSIFGVSGQTATSAPGVGFFTGPTLVATPSPAPSATALGTATPTPTPVPTGTLSPLTYTPNVYARIFPSGVDPADTANVLPFNSDVTLFLYAIDSTTAPSGVELIGTFSN